MKHSFLAVVLSVVFLRAPFAVADPVSTVADGLTLNANLETTENWPEGPVVVLTHGTLAHSGMEIMKSLQTMLADRGLGSLAINLSLGIDDRQPAMYDCATPHMHKHLDAVGEISTWVEWLKGQGVERIVLLGHSRGGNQAARYAAAQPDAVVSDLVLIAPSTWDEGYPEKDYAQRYGTSLQPVLAQAQSLVESGRGEALIGPIGFIYCENAQASAEAVVSYYTPDPDMDTPRLLSRLGMPVVVFAGSEDTVVAGLIDKTEPLADGEKVELVVLDGADHFFRDLYAEDIADAIVERVGD